MKKEKLALLLILSSLFCLVLNSIQVNALAYANNGNADKQKAGAYYVWIHESDGLYVAKSETEDGKKLLDWNVSKGNVLWNSFYSDGTYIFYAVIPEGSSYRYPVNKIYRMKMNGKNKTYVGKVTGDLYFKHYYKNKLFFNKDTQEDMEELSAYTLDTSTKKTKLIRKDYKVTSGYKNQVLLAEIRRDNLPHKIFIYNTGNGKHKKIGDNLFGAVILSGRLYYLRKTAAENETGNYQMEVKSASTALKDVKTLSSDLSFCDLKTITAKYVEYHMMVDGKYVLYRYTYATKEAEAK